MSEINTPANAAISEEVETKEARFLRIATPRVNKVINAIQVLSNCSGSAYGYTEDQVKNMFDAIQEALDNAQAQFQPKTAKAKNTFNF